MFPRPLRDLYEPTDYHRCNIMPGGVSPASCIIIRERPQVPVAPFKSDANKVQVMVSVKHFRPHDIEVKTVDNFVVIHGKHEERADEHGFVSREFTIRSQLSDDVEPDTVTASLSQDGVLKIQAPPKKCWNHHPRTKELFPLQFSCQQLSKWLESNSSFKSSNSSFKSNKLHSKLQGAKSSE
ncbi:protein lethal(2)essential for life [Caerostris extrusa]|uniref:Protein lethal(2)essential for life n=1 Tax=Caerostris extrusa TaxID=172846 RepID=A0AAV4V6X0_CAEEX|nr:protein lethal(2)essential for life [Caerostris extrusa]